MSLWGDQRDISLIRHINRELLNNIIEQKVGYYKIILDKTTSNVYGEASGTKTYADPVLINCLIDRPDPNVTSDDLGPDIIQNVNFRFLRDDLAGNSLSVELSPDGKGFTYNVVPEMGDVIVWNENYYEVDRVIENQFIFGKVPEYSYSENNDNFGNSLSIICEAHYMRPEKLGLSIQRI